MKKRVLIIDIVLMMLTIAYMIYNNNSTETGLAALSSAGKFVLAMMCLGVETLVLVIVGIILIYDKKNKHN